MDDRVLAILEKESEALRNIASPPADEENFTKEEQFLFWREVGIRAAAVVVGALLVIYPLNHKSADSYGQLLIGSGISILTGAVALNMSGNKKSK